MIHDIQDSIFNTLAVSLVEARKCGDGKINPFDASIGLSVSKIKGSLSPKRDCNTSPCFYVRLYLGVTTQKSRNLGKHPGQCILYAALKQQ